MSERLPTWTPMPLPRLARRCQVSCLSRDCQIGNSVSLTCFAMPQLICSARTSGVNCLWVPTLRLLSCYRVDRQAGAGFCYGVQRPAGVKHQVPQRLQYGNDWLMWFPSRRMSYPHNDMTLSKVLHSTFASVLQSALECCKARRFTAQQSELERLGSCRCDTLRLCLAASAAPRLLGRRRAWARSTRTTSCRWT